MCTEFLLAFLYFSIIFIINFLLVNLLISYRKSFISLVKLQKIFKFFERKNLSLLLLLNNNEKKELKVFSFLNELKNFPDTKDILIIGNVYKSFSRNQKNNSTTFYFLLLEQQYLFSKEK